MNYNTSEITTTKIADLPMMGGSGGGGINTIKIDRPPKLGEVNTTYQNLNVHKNPYFNDEEPIGQQQQLPSRDIPQNTQGYTIDPETRANYVPPPPPHIDDYLRDTELITNKRVKKHQEKQKRKAQMLDILSDFQFSIYIALLFLLFNLPIIDGLLFSILARFDGVFFYQDGNINLTGLAVKSAIFGTVYYLLQKAVDFVVV
jgi:hypothetical protein